MKGKYKELTNNTLIFAIGTMGSKLILFFLVPLYTNFLTTSEYGTADLVQTVSMLMVPVFSIMIQDAMLRFGLSKGSNQIMVLKNSFVVLGIGSLISLAFLPILCFYKPIYNWVLYLYGILFTNMVSNILFAYVKTVNKNRLYALCGILSSFVLAGSNIISLTILKLGIEGYLLSIIIYQLFSCIFLILGSNIHNNIIKTTIDYKLLKDMILYSIPLVINNLSWWILNSSDKVMIEYYTGTNGLGLYTAASKIPALISVVNSIFLQAWTISSIKDYEEERDSSFFTTIFTYYSIAMFGCVSFLHVIIKPLMNVYVGVSFQESWKYVPFLLLGAVYYGFSLFFGTIYSAAKKNINIAVSTLIAALVNIFINYILLKRIGVLAASISTATSYFVVSVYRMIDTRRLLKFDVKVSLFIINSILCIVETLVLTFEWHSNVLTVVLFIIFLIINIKSIINIPKYLIGLKNKK